MDTGTVVLASVGIVTAGQVIVRAIQGGGLSKIVKDLDRVVNGNGSSEDSLASNVIIIKRDMKSMWREVDAIKARLEKVGG